MFEIPGDCKATPIPIERYRISGSSRSIRQLISEAINQGYKILLVMPNSGNGSAFICEKVIQVPNDQ